MKIQSIVSVILVLQLILTANSVRIFNIKDFGARPSQDISKVLERVWSEAVKSTKATQVLIPRGDWNLSQAILSGPNKAPINLEVRGHVRAYPDVAIIAEKEKGWIYVSSVDHLTISGGGILDGQGSEAWENNDCKTNATCEKPPLNMYLNAITNSIIRDVTTKDSKYFHVNCLSSRNVTFQRFTVSAPRDSPNTDGIHIARSVRIRVTDSVIQTGDDCISMGDDLRDVLIKNVACGPGHGISIGSLGKYEGEKDVKGIRVEGCSFRNTTNGVRVKTFRSSPANTTVSDLHFIDLTMVNAANPVIIDGNYCPNNQCASGLSGSVKISGVEINNVIGTSSTQNVITFNCSQVCKRVNIGTIDLTYKGKKGSSATTFCKNIKPNFTKFTKQNPPVCPSKSAIYLLSKALKQAWNEAIKSTKATQVLIPRGDWDLSQALLSGPNKAPINLEVQGHLIAYPDPAKIPEKKMGWIGIEKVDYLTISGGGILDGGDEKRARHAHHVKSPPSTCS
ncbi:exopolygalacturonase-like [Salvia hispanica]|uniref:exopolygalacturonase-like n=1 Tax=Salvia hispanica TaxID=49212 RepID=UPI0020099B26|nr:exopolygalacturonase-like [Salvia hispanica]